MSDTSKSPEQSAAADPSTEKLSDLPNKVVSDQDAASVKGGTTNLVFQRPVPVKSTTVFGS